MRPGIRRSDFAPGFGPYLTYFDDIIPASVTPENQSGEPEALGELLIEPAIDRLTNVTNNWAVPSVMNDLPSYKDVMHINDNYGYAGHKFLIPGAPDDPSDSSSSTSTSDEEGLNAAKPPNPYQREYGGGLLSYGGQ